MVQGLVTLDLAEIDLAAIEAILIEALAKCTKRHALNATRNVKYLLNLQKENQSTVRIASKSINHRGFRWLPVANAVVQTSNRAAIFPMVTNLSPLRQ